MKPNTNKEWWAALEKRFQVIENIALTQKQWKGVVPTLREEWIREPPKVVQWWANWKKKKINASVIHPPAFADCIWLYDRYWTLPFNRQVSILVHEWVHIVQRHEGKLNYIKYITDNVYKGNVEGPAYQEQAIFERFL